MRLAAYVLPPNTPGHVAPFTEFALYDVIRMFTAVGALLLGLMVLRLLALRIYRRTVRDPRTPHPLTSLSFAVLLITTAIRRLDNLGAAPDVFLWLTAFAVASGLTGVCIRAMDWPWRVVLDRMR